MWPEVKAKTRNNPSTVVETVFLVFLTLTEEPSTPVRVLRGVELISLRFHQKCCK